jgi:hypothetical protein
VSDDRLRITTEADRERQMVNLLRIAEGTLAAFRDEHGDPA